jgi:hypothetical protein
VTRVVCRRFSDHDNRDHARRHFNVKMAEPVIQIASVRPSPRNVRLAAAGQLRKCVAGLTRACAAGGLIKRAVLPTKAVGSRNPTRDSTAIFPVFIAIVARSTAFRCIVGPCNRSNPRG